RTRLPCTRGATAVAETCVPWHGRHRPSGTPMTYTFRFAPVFSRIDQMLDGLVLTLWLTGIVIVAGFVLGVAGALATRARAAWLRAAVRCYVEAIRNTPLLVQLFFIYFGLPGLGLRLDAITAGLIALTV